MKIAPSILDHPRAIAIIGMAGRFPGARNIEQFHRNLSEGVESITFFSDSELLRAGVDPQLLTNPNYVKAAPLLEDVDLFDASFFQYSAHDAEIMDPQHRIFLECAWEALESAGYAGATDQYTIGVFGGAGSLMGSYLLSDSHVNEPLLGAICSREHIGNDKDHLCTRVSYKLNLRGPSLTVQTACSTSLVTVHLACQSLLNSECDMALAGGVSVRVPQHVGYLYQKGTMFSPDGHCRAFDAKGEGTLFGSGVGIVVLKPLKKAIADRDHIYAVIRGSAINNDGSDKMSYWATNAQGQTEAIVKALAVSEVEPETIGYVEAHGTATHLGDMIEMYALKKAFKTPKRGFCAVGSVKTNIGHTDAASGIAGLIKAVLSLEHKALFPSLHFSQPNPRIGFANSPFVVNTKFSEWEARPYPRRAAVNSLGIGGTNAHVILEEAPHQTAAPAEMPVERSMHLLTLSAKTVEGLQALAKEYHEHLRRHPTQSFADVCYTANTGRGHFDHRLALVATTREEAYEQLESFGQAVSPVKKGHIKRNQPPRIAFLFTGQGSQYIGMGRELYETEATFRKIVNQCNEILQPYLPESLINILYSFESGINQTAITQPALFAIEYALAKLWQSWGVEPDVVMGHSVGEYVAACIAGVFSLEDGLRLIAERGRLMQALPQNGAMMAVLAGEPVVASAIAPYADSLSIAAINGPKNVVISGTHQAVQSAVARLPEGIRTIPLTVSHAFHSPLMEPMLADFLEVARSVTFNPPQIKLIANARGDITTPEYWCRHLRETVRFAEGMEKLHQLGVDTFVEIGPKPTLLGMGRRCLRATQAWRDNYGTWLPSLRPDAEWSTLLPSLAQLYVRGVEIDWAGFYRDNRRHKIVLPTYPFQRERYWLSTPKHQTPLLPSGNTFHPLLGQRLRLPFSEEIRFESQFAPHTPAFMDDHRLYQILVVPAASHISMVLLAVKEAFKTDACILEELFFPQALILSENKLQTVQLVLTRQDDARYAFQLISLKEGEDENRKSSWAIHATGKIRVGSNDTESGRQEPVTIEAVSSRYRKSLSRAQFYDLIWQVGYTLGSSFRWNGSIWRREKEALCQIEPPLLEESGAYQLHPGLIDSCLQMLTNFWSVDATELSKTQQIYLPFLIDQVKFYGRPTPNSQLWCQALLREGESEHHQGLTGDIRLFDETGRIMAEIVGFELRRADRRVLQQAKDLSDWFYQVAWQSKPNNKQPVYMEESGSWLIFADRGGVGEKVAELLSERGEHCVLLFAGSGYRRLDRNRYCINPAELLEFQEAITQNKQLPAFRGIVHLWSLDGIGWQDITPASLQETSLLGSVSVLHTIQGLVEQDHFSNVRLWLVTRMAQSVTETPLSVAQAPLWGLGRVIVREHPELDCVCLDLETGTEAQQVFDELWFQSNEDQIAYRRAVRHVARMVPFSPSFVKRSLLKAHGSYLITGGLGALGLTVARWLVKQGARSIVLMGRRGASTVAQREAIRQFEQTGTQVLVVQADVSDQEQVARALSEVKAKMPPLRGIIHAAGVLSDGLILRQNRARMLDVFAPKVAGSWNLHTLTQKLPLDFFVCFSSIAPLMGSPGQGNYAAANAFMDMLCHHRRALGLPALSINWGAWAEKGMAARAPEQWKQLVASWGMSFLTIEEGLQALEQALQQNSPQLAVLPINWSKFMQHLFSVDASPAFFSEVASQVTAPERVERPEGTSAKQLDFLRQVQEASPTARRKLLTSYVQNEVIKILGTRQAPNPQQGFFDMGMDSLMAVELRSKLEATLGTSLPATLTFKYPTISTMADYLVETLAPQDTELPLATEFEVQEKEDREELTDRVALLEQLSEEEVEALLLQKLARF